MGVSESTIKGSDSIRDKEIKKILTEFKKKAKVDDGIAHLDRDTFKGILCVELYHDRLTVKGRRTMYPTTNRCWTGFSIWWTSTITI